MLIVVKQLWGDGNMVARHCEDVKEPGCAPDACAKSGTGSMGMIESSPEAQTDSGGQTVSSSGLELTSSLSYTYTSSPLWVTS